MSKPLKRAVLIDFINNLSFSCDKCGGSVKPVFKCSNCRTAVNPSKIHFHRVIPLSMGGKDELSNVMMLCDKCHGKVDSIRLKRIKRKDEKLTRFGKR